MNRKTFSYVFYGTNFCYHLCNCVYIHACMCMCVYSHIYVVCVGIVCVRMSVFVCMCVCVRPILVFVRSNLIWSDTFTIQYKWESHYL